MEYPLEMPPGYVLQSRDSSYWAERMQVEHWAALDAAAKATLYRSLSRAVEELHLRGLRELHPRASQEELRLRAAAIRLGPDLVRELTGFDASGG